MACCCYFCCGILINTNVVISVKENHYQALFANGEGATSSSNLPSINLSPSYSDWSNSWKAGGFPDLMTLGEFNIQRSEDEIGCFILIDFSDKQVCVIRCQPSCCGNCRIYLYSDNHRNELIRVAIERNAPQGSRQIGSVKFCLTCTCSSEKIYGKTSDLYLQVKTEQYGRRYKSSRNNEEIGQVYTTGGRAKGFFPAYLELAMKIGVITKGVDLILSQYG